MTVFTQPSDPSQACTVTNASGTLAGANVTNVEVSCTTEPPEVTLSTTTLDFGTLAFGDSSTVSVLVDSSGSSDLVISAITDPGAPFAITGGSCTNLPVTLAPGENCQIDIEYTPTSAGGAASASFEIQTNAASSPSTVNLQAAGQPVPVPMMNRFGLLLLMALMIVMAAVASTFSSGLTLSPVQRG